MQIYSVTMVTLTVNIATKTLIILPLTDIYKICFAYSQRCSLNFIVFFNSQFIFRIRAVKLQRNFHCIVRVEGCLTNIYINMFSCRYLNAHYPLMLKM